MTEYYRYVSLKFTAQFTPEQLLNNSELQLCAELLAET